MYPSIRTAFALAAVLLISVGGLAACSEDPGGGDDVAQGPAGVERAFLSAMVPHHESAIAVARVAGGGSENPDVQRLARGIIDAQEREIATMEEIHVRLFDEPLVPDEGAHEVLGLSASAAGMDHGDSAAALTAAADIDAAFIADMVPHHEGAVAMAEAVLAVTADPELRSLASRIVADQTAEIAEMLTIRAELVGAPAGDGDDPGRAEHGGHGG